MWNVHAPDFLFFSFFRPAVFQQTVFTVMEFSYGFK